MGTTFPPSLLTPSLSIFSISETEIKLKELIVGAKDKKEAPHPDPPSKFQILPPLAFSPKTWSSPPPPWDAVSTVWISGSRHDFHFVFNTLDLIRPTRFELEKFLFATTVLPEKTGVNTIFVFDLGGYQVPASPPRVAILVPEVLCEAPPRPSNGGASPHYDPRLTSHNNRTPQPSNSRVTHMSQPHRRQTSTATALYDSEFGRQGYGWEMLMEVQFSNGLSNWASLKLFYFGPMDFFVLSNLPGLHCYCCRVPLPAENTCILTLVQTFAVLSCRAEPFYFYGSWTSIHLEDKVFLQDQWNVMAQTSRPKYHELT